MKKLLIFVLVIFISGCGSEINGSSAVKWILSIAKIGKENNKLEEQLLFIEAMSRIFMLSYAENNPNFNKMEYQNMVKNNPEEIRTRLAGNPVVMMDVMKKTDGMDFDDVIDAGNDANEELNKILSERPVTVAIAPIPSQPEIIKSAPVETNVAAPVVTQTEKAQEPKTEVQQPTELKPILEAQKTEQAQQNTQEKQEVERLKQEAEVSKLEAEKLQALQEKQDADRVKQEFLNKQSVVSSEQSADSQVVESQAEKIQQSEPAPKNKAQHIQKMLKDAINNDESSIQASKQYLENQPKPAKGDKKAARKMNEEALKLIQSQQYDQALPLFAKATQIDPSDVEILNNYGFVLMKSRNLDKALSVLTNTLTMKPDRASAWANLADVLALQGHVDLATGGYMNVYRFSGNREKTYKNLQNPQVHEDSPYVREALANAVQKIIR